jgi:hypothetical protein
VLQEKKCYKNIAGLLLFDSKRSGSVFHPQAMDLNIEDLLVFSLNGAESGCISEDVGAQNT